MVARRDQSNGSVRKVKSSAPRTKSWSKLTLSNFSIQIHVCRTRKYTVIWMLNTYINGKMQWWNQERTLPLWKIPSVSENFRDIGSENFNTERRSSFCRKQNRSKIENILLNFVLFLHLFLIFISFFTFGLKRDCRRGKSTGGKFRRIPSENVKNLHRKTNFPINRSIRVKVLGHKVPKSLFPVHRACMDTLEIEMNLQCTC